MTRISRATLFGLPIESLDEMLAKVDAIEVDDLTELAAGALRRRAALGRLRRRRRGPLPRGAGAGQRGPGSGMTRVAVAGAAGQNGRDRLRGGRGGRGLGAERARRSGAGGRAGRGPAARPTSSSTSPFPTPRSPTSAPASRRASTPSSAPPASTSTPPAPRPRRSQANCFVAPNFAIGAVLLMEVSQTIATHMPECEIVELHHDSKLDAPSGTAKRTAGADRRGGRQRPPADPLGPAAGPGRPPGSDLRRRRADPLDPPRLDRPPLLHARRRPRLPQGRPTSPTASRSGWRSCCRSRRGRRTGYPESDEGDQGSPHRDGDPVRRERGGRPRRAPGASRRTCSSTARTAW